MGIESVVNVLEIAQRLQKQGRAYQNDQRQTNLSHDQDLSQTKPGTATALGGRVLFQRGARVYAGGSYGGRYSKEYAGRDRYGGREGQDSQVQTHVNGQRRSACERHAA